jgi:hypothetical protein
MYVMLLKTLAPCARKVRGRGESEGAPKKKKKKKEKRSE